jgi:ABC-type Mn2+/Zn2+ transport system permease subunit
VAEKTQAQKRKRGMRDVVMAILAAAMIVTPSYISYIMTGRFKVEISIAAVFSIIVFLIGVFLLVRLLKD